MKDIIKVSVAQLADVLVNIDSTTPVTIVADTVVKMNKKGNPFYNRIRKVQESNVFINMSYEDAVNRRLVKEGKETDFEVANRTWGERINGSPVISRRLTSGEVKYYLETFFVTKNKPKVEYFVDNDGTLESIEKSEFESYLPATKEGSGRQGLDEELVIRTFGVENLKEVRVAGKIYEVVE